MPFIADGIVNTWEIINSRLIKKVRNEIDIVIIARAAK